MDLGHFAYDPSRPSSSRTRFHQQCPSYWSMGGGRRKGNWDALSDDLVTYIFSHLDDRQLAKLARNDKRFHALAKAEMRRQLKLSPSQWEAFCAVLERRESILLTGPPGSGKSYLLNILKVRMNKPLVTASTGAAAEKIGAQTFHSAFCLGVGGNTLQQIMAKPAFCRQQIICCRSVIVDEVSMLSRRSINLAEAVVRQTVGGMPQLVACGDPLQLSAVSAESEGAFFKSAVIKGLKPYVLRESHRQGGGGKFLRVLNRARLGQARQQDLNYLRNQSMPEHTITHEPPRLFCVIRETEWYNRTRMMQLHGPEHTYTLSATGTPTSLQKWASTLPPAVTLKVGARVILLVNLRIGLGLHNGSTGTVMSLTPNSVDVQFDNGTRYTVCKTTSELVKDEKVIATRTQMPLLVAFALSVHRAQGATLDSLVLDLSRCFAAGQAYVALSRVRSVKDVCIKGLSLRALNMVDADALKFYQKTVARAEKHQKERQERKRARADVYEGVYDDELSKMMDRFERERAARAAP